MSKALTIATMPVATQARLTDNVRKQLIGIILGEFTNKDSLFHQMQEAEKEKIIAGYQKKVGYHKLKAEHDKKEAEIAKLKEQQTQIAKKIEATGLNTNGAPASRYVYVNGQSVLNYEAVELEKLLKAVEKNAPSENLKNKLLTRLALATTVGEANVIMREVLGNGLIPDLQQDEVKIQ